MWPDDFKRDLEAIWGSRKGIQGFVDYTGLSRSVVERYCNGAAPIPRHVALLSQALVKLCPKWYEGQTTTSRVRPFPKIEAPWLPGEEKNHKFRVARRPFG
jgi:hypothetical protein